MSEQHQEGDIPVGELADQGGDRPAKPRCPCCGGRDFNWLGRKFEGIEYIPRENEGALFSLARVFKARIRVCLDCGFVGFFAHPDFRSRLADDA